jgi:potassium efflux system protein
MKKHLFAAAALILFLARPGCAVDALSLVTETLGGSTETTEAASKDTTPQPYTPSSSDIEANSKRLAEVNDLLDQWSKVSAEEAAPRYGVKADAITQRVEILTSLKNAYPRIESAINQKKQDDAELEKTKSNTASPELDLDEKPPYTLEYYEDFNEGIDELRKQSDSAQDALTLSSEYAGNSQIQLDSAEAAWRLARDTLQKQNSQVNQWNLQNAALTVEMYRAQLILDTFSKEHAAATAELYKEQIRQRSSLHEYVWNNLSLSEKDFTAQVNALNEQVKDLEKQQNTLSRQLRQAENALAAAEQKNSAAKEADAKASAAAELSYRTADRDRYRLAQEHLQETLVLMATRKRMWTTIYDLRNNALNRHDVPDTVKKISTDTAALEAKIRTAQKSLLSLQARLSEVDKQISDENTSKTLLSTLKKHRSTMQSAIQDSLDYITTLGSIVTLENQVSQMLQQAYKTVGIAQKTFDTWKKKTAAALNTELWQSGGYAVRLKEFLIALAIILFGTWGARRLVRMFSWVAAKYFKFDETGRRTFDRFVFYLAVIIIFLTALHIVGIPLTAFAFLGGAVAIAIGFGAQNIFKNIMGGILLTVNRPFRIGDIIEVAGVCGTVTDLGVRSTLIRTFDEKEVVVPNSQLMDNQLINWSFSDSLLRVAVNFGVEYGTPAKKVRDVVLDIVDKNPKILKKPEPWVYFADFGDSDLDFTLYFWINQKIASSLRVSSEIREAIQTRFDEENIQMAYPHMDVNLLNTAPAQNDTFKGPEEPAGNDDAPQAREL